MDEQTDARVADALLRHARRALLLLGGAFVWWLMTAGAPAHAADGGHDPVLSDGVRHALTNQTTSLERTTGAVSGTVRRAPATVSGRVDETTAAAPAPVREPVRHPTAVTMPVLDASTTVVADTVDRAVHTAHQVLDPVFDPVLDPALVAVDGTAGATTSPVTNAAHDRGRTSTRGADHAALAPAAMSVDTATAPAGEHAVPTQQPARDRLPSGSTPASAPTASWGGGSGPNSGVLWHLTPLLASRRRLSAHDSIRPGPALPPGSSPY
jgi:hypothetical protein